MRGWGSALPARFQPQCPPRRAQLGSPIFPSGCEGKLGVALESLQGGSQAVPVGITLTSEAVWTPCLGWCGRLSDPLAL